MDCILARFVAALRTAGVRVSPAETIDALQVLELVGYRDRQTLKDSLSLALPKTVDDKELFEATFDRFFSFENLRPRADADADAEVDGGHRALPLPSSPLGTLLMQRDTAQLALRMAEAARRSHLEDMRVFTQKGLYANRIMDALGLADLTREIEALRASDRVPERRLGQHLARRRDHLREQVRDHVERQFLLHADAAGRRMREELLRTVKLSNIEQRNFRLLQDVVLRMAKRLAALHARRRKVSRRGRLDMPRTLRRNMRYDGAIFDVQWKSAKADRPKVFALCDVSGSVARHARFMLLFLYSLEAVLPKVRAFASSSALSEVTQWFSPPAHSAPPARSTLDDAIAKTLRDCGGGATDYGQAFADFRDLCMKDVDKRTTIIILGDARNNYGNPRTAILRQLRERAKRIIWLNPEPRSLWNTGDSEMRGYSACVHQAQECNSLAHLESVVGNLLRASA